MSKIATLSVVSTLLYHRSYRVLDPYRPFWIFMEVSADNSFPDFRSPFPALRSPLPVPRFSNIPEIRTRRILREKADCKQSRVAMPLR